MSDSRFTNADRYAEVVIGSASDRAYVYKGGSAGLTGSGTLVGTTGSDFSKAMACRMPVVFTPALSLRRR